MSITTGWFDKEHRIIANTFNGQFTWEEISSALGDVEALADTVDYDLVVFTDMRQSNVIPKGNALTPAKASMRLLPSNITFIVIVIQSRLVEVFAKLLFDMLPAWRNRIRFVRSYEEGKLLVEEAVIANTARP